MKSVKLSIFLAMMLVLAFSASATISSVVLQKPADSAVISGTYTFNVSFTQVNDSIANMSIVLESASGTNTTACQNLTAVTANISDSARCDYATGSSADGTYTVWGIFRNQTGAQAKDSSTSVKIDNTAPVIRFDVQTEHSNTLKDVFVDCSRTTDATSTANFTLTVLNPDGALATTAVTTSSNTWAGLVFETPGIYKLYCYVSDQGSNQASTNTDLVVSSKGVSVGASQTTTSTKSDAQKGNFNLLLLGGGVLVSVIILLLAVYLLTRPKKRGK